MIMHRLVQVRTQIMIHHLKTTFLPELDKHLLDDILRLGPNTYQPSRIHHQWPVKLLEKDLQSSFIPLFQIRQYLISLFHEPHNL